MGKNTAFGRPGAQERLRTWWHTSSRSTRANCVLFGVVGLVVVILVVAATSHDDARPTTGLSTLAQPGSEPPTSLFVPSTTQVPTTVAPATSSTTSTTVSAPTTTRTTLSSRAGPASTAATATTGTTGPRPPDPEPVPPPPPAVTATTAAAPPTTSLSSPPAPPPSPSTTVGSVILPLAVPSPSSGSR